ncbi:aldehyde dehydrogenase family protein [Agrobacterium rhizogenes]|uniref:aldehyde dehydrogenase family protein n=1 Tax=Rhizobium rhizogenes TaxID=359 RepID=UPI0015738A43|nr:aldehyde dehydrogenase family protein [Rhizobium rhizogenes]NTG90930.1 aldehyde dehydrogenase family protein [Rhizobium rhizogenes]NTI20203.1 aldehyde dehydrogenase family protein [Rhizobium rhizogenes]NTI39251.1 aldehyde dehydrogenase family protein [Rhizobium rhizogenes]WEO69033.1 aldehyde dehydrogenase family protein [Rhizobium rhizogenes]
MNLLRTSENSQPTTAQTGAQSRTPVLLFINGTWRPAAATHTFADINPTTRLPYATVADGDVSDIESAIAAAKVAQPAWEALPPAARSGFFYKAAEIFQSSQEKFVNALMEETGSGLGKAMFECSLIPLALREAAALTTRATGEILPSNIPGKVNTISRTAAGVVGVISPWNFPLYLSLRGFVYALALGNTAVLKPSEDSPVSGGTILAELFEAAGLPSGVFNVVTCSRDKVKAVAAAMINDPRVARISFTGSTAVGREVATTSAAQFKRVVLELGGKNPVVVLDDADVDYAVNVAFFSAFLHQGQICMSADKIIVARNLYDSFVEKLIAKVSMFEPLEPSNPMAVIAPIINDRQLDRIDRLVKSARDAGATIHLGGEKLGPFYRPTVMTGVTRDMDIYHEEIFGPVAFVIPADSEEEAIALANDTVYGLSSSIITGNATRGQILATQIEAGMVHVNDTCVHDEPHCPFGGMKASGWVGKWGASGAIEAFTEQRWISVQTVPRAFPF